jgi:hypothetical protein
MMRYIIGIVVALGLIVFVIILLVKSFGGSAPVTQKISLPSYANTSAIVRMTIDGPVTSDQTHEDVQMSVDSNQATLTVTQGYDGQVISTNSYATGSNAFAVFLRSLDTYGFTLGNTNSALKDERGQCANGDRYIYEIIDGNSNTVQHLWHTSCGTGTSKASYGAIGELFENQFPDYDQIVNNVNI